MLHRIYLKRSKYLIYPHASSLCASFYTAVFLLSLLISLRIKFITDNVFSLFLNKSSPPPREAFLAWMTFAANYPQGIPLLQICQRYWDCFYTFNCCFNDLRRFVELLEPKQRKIFQSYASDAARSASPKADKKQVLSPAHLSIYRRFNIHLFSNLILR